MTLKKVSIPSFQENLVPKMKYIPNATWKFSSQSSSSSLIINMTFEIMDLDPKLKTGQILSQNCNVPNFYEIWHLQQIEHANYEYYTCQCLERLHDYWL